MGETTTVVRDAEAVPGAVVHDLATTVGGLENEAKHIAAELIKHGERLTNIEEKHTWIQTQLDNIANRVTEAPPEAIAELRRDLEAVRADLTGQVAALSEATIPERKEPETEAPRPARNEAEPKKDAPGGLRKILHRLL